MEEQTQVTIPSFASYTAPGVYVAPTNTPIVTVGGTTAQVPAIVGPALGYRTAVQSFLVYAASGAILTFTGVFTTEQTGPPVIAAPVVVVTGTSTVLTLGTDYTLTVTPDPSGNAALAVTSVFRVSGSPNISDGAQVTITYCYADASYYQPQLFTNLQAVISAYGQPLVSSAPTTPNTSQVSSPLSYGAQVAFAAGASQVWCLACNPAEGTLQQQFAAAWPQLLTIASATILVPVFPDYLTAIASPSTVPEYVLAIATELDEACDAAAAAGFPRIGFLGLPIDYSESLTPIPSFTAQINDERLVLVYPEIVQAYSSQTRQVFLASACYLAAFLAGVLSTLPVNTGLTGQPVSAGFALTAAEVAAMTPAFMNTIAASGVTVVYQTMNGGLAVRQGLTTQMADLNTREISMVRQSDALLLMLETGLQASGLIGSPITATMVATVQGAITSILQQAVNQAVIISFTNLSVQQVAYPGGDPTIIQCSFAYAPAVPLNYITVTYSIDLSNGLVAAASASAQQASSPTTTG